MVLSGDAIIYYAAQAKHLPRVSGHPKKLGGRSNPRSFLAAKIGKLIEVGYTIVKLWPLKI